MTATRPTLILLGYYAPPAAGVAVNRLVATAEAMRDAGWRVVVVAPEAPHYHATGAPMPPGIETIRVRTRETSGGLRRAWSRVRGRGGPGASGANAPDPAAAVEMTEAAGGAVTSILRRFAHRALYVPDAQHGFIAPAADAIRRAVAEAGSDAVVLSTSVPHSSHLAVLRAREAASFRWVAEYRDPWTSGRPAPGWDLRAHVDRRLDQSILRAAPDVVVTSDATRELFLDDVPGLAPDRVHVVRNGFARIGEGIGPGPDDPFVLRYAGNLLDAAWATPLLHAIREIRDAGAGAPVLEVFGAREPWRRAWGAGETPAWLRLEGFVPVDRVARAVGSAAATVQLRPGTQWRWIVAGKTYDYLGGRRPVIAWTEPGIEMTRLVAEHGDLRHVATGTVAEFRHAIERLLREHAEGRLRAPAVEAERVEGLSRAAQLEHLRALLEAGIGGPRHV